MAKYCKILYLDRAEFANFALLDCGYCPNCGAIFTKIDRKDIINCPNCDGHVYGRLIAIENGLVVERDNIN